MKKTYPEQHVIKSLYNIMHSKATSKVLPSFTA